MILLVDDESELRGMIKDVLQNANYQCSEASNSKEAIKKYSTGKFKGVILDIGMPGGNGIELVKELKKHDSKVKIICLSGYSELLEADLANEKVEYIMGKPFDEKAFIEMVGKAFA